MGIENQGNFCRSQQKLKLEAQAWERLGCSSARTTSFILLFKLIRVSFCLEYPVKKIQQRDSRTTSQLDENDDDLRSPNDL